MKNLYQDTGQRGDVLKNVHRIVIKVGTRLLTDMGNVSKAERVEQLVSEINDLRQGGLEVLLVTSGAIGAGMMLLQTAKRPHALPQLQAHAAVGQSRLMYLYETACVKHGFHAAQLLLTAADVQDRERHLNVTSCLDALLDKGVLPVINENDSVSVAEIRFGDNDSLAALVASIVRADLTVLLTTVDGVIEGLGTGAGTQRRISVVPAVDNAIFALAGGTDGNRFSVGGMTTKLHAAELVTKTGKALWIADGRDFHNLSRIVAGEDIGTLFTAGQARMKAHKRFLAFFSEHAGDLTIDAGAERALAEGGRSLLPSGIVAVRGTFKRGDTVRIFGLNGIQIAKGISNYSSDEVLRIMGRKSTEISRALGHDAYDEEVVHRNALALT